MKISFKNRITSHLRENNITYYCHMKRAIKISLLMATGSIACFIHAILPFLFETTGTRMLEKARLL